MLRVLALEWEHQGLQSLPRSFEKTHTAKRAKVLMLGPVAPRLQFGARIAPNNLASFSDRRDFL